MIGVGGVAFFQNRETKCRVSVGSLAPVSSDLGVKKPISWPGVGGVGHLPIVIGYLQRLRLPTAEGVGGCRVGVPQGYTQNLRDTPHLWWFAKPEPLYVVVK